MNWKQRLSAMALHSVFSLFLLLIALFLVFHLWYPAPLDKAMGVGAVFWIILIIDLILGPLLTFAVFNPKKKELKMDLFFIVMIQLGAYLYGLHTVAQGRPVFQVFVVDDIELVRAIDLKYDSSFSINKEFQTHIFSQPRWVSAVYSSDPKIAFQQKQDEMFGNSLASRPETYQPFEARKEQVQSKVNQIVDLYKFNNKRVVEDVLKMYSSKKIIGFLPVKGFEEDMSVLIGEDAEPVAIVDLRPWK
ncbi:TfpX/TfpZ family type IV pilin accessory protein [Acinetobacter haemolyticus]|uniref:TfpX/TfpZ family type IV pilin accessory protein n=1 Tax=Acinetobacter haemolyticus TaxID=29430 RepID=UPI002A69E95C|nr:TfpX/TfpZ family type IV pilin accessory protein [Acinetobacter haemolyticus]WPO67662.1 TfpX/TfpZ family type IV pilin accessory protein [Acinetobacter haemolyticus]